MTQLPAAESSVGIFRSIDGEGVEVDVVVREFEAAPDHLSGIASSLYYSQPVSNIIVSSQSTASLYGITSLVYLGFARQWNKRPQPKSRGGRI